MEQDPTLTEAAIDRSARPQSFERGENYYDRGAVIGITRRGDLLRAQVEGRQYESHQVWIELDEPVPSTRREPVRTITAGSANTASPSC